VKCPRGADLAWKSRILDPSQTSDHRGTSILSKGCLFIDYDLLSPLLLVAAARPFFASLVPSLVGLYCTRRGCGPLLRYQCKPVEDRLCDKPIHQLSSGLPPIPILTLAIHGGWWSLPIFAWSIACYEISNSEFSSSFVCCTSWLYPTGFHQNFNSERHWRSNRVFLILDSHGIYDICLGLHPYVQYGGWSGLEIEVEFYEGAVPLPTLPPITLVLYC